ncbi:MAG: hypothetical protein RI996_355 [Candidatus Parcubacteria bacterium]|jgi:hypothetical protein
MVVDQGSITMNLESLFGQIIKITIRGSNISYIRTVVGIDSNTGGQSIVLNEQLRSSVGTIHKQHDSLPHMYFDTVHMRSNYNRITFSDSEGFFFAGKEQSGIYQKVLVNIEIFVPPDSELTFARIAKMQSELV